MGWSSCRLIPTGHAFFERNPNGIGRLLRQLPQHLVGWRAFERWSAEIPLYRKPLSPARCGLIDKIACLMRSAAANDGTAHRQRPKLLRDHV